MRSTPSLFVAFAVVAAVASSAYAASVTVTVTGSGSSRACSFTDGIVAGGTAWGTFNDSSLVTGWGNLEIWTSQEGASSHDAAVTTAFGVGCVEGMLTQPEIFNMVQNAKANMFPGGKLPLVAELYVGVQELSMRLNIAKNTAKGASMPPYWRGMSLVMAHYDGLNSAYQQVAPAAQNLSAIDLYAVSSADDLGTLANLESDARVELVRKLRAGQEALASWQDWGSNPDHLPSIDFDDCSAFVRIGTEGLVVAHTTWANFWEMIRVYKIFHLSYAPAATISFSSYPGYLSSGDDWYITKDTKLAVTETTNNIYDKSQFLHLDPFAAFSWQRAITATWFATSPQDWSELFSVQNSGTYNCQWIIVKLNGTVPTKDSSNYLYITEQIPGYMQSGDMTQHLVSEGNWVSYNIPYFQKVYNMSGYNVMYEKYGNAYSYSECPRAQIFRRNISAVVDAATAMELIRYNNYKHDPLSHGIPMNAIDSRGDLLPTPIGFGGIDAKVVDDASVSSGKLEVHAIAGPTHQQLPPFRWSENAIINAIAHEGQPDVFDFQWQLFTPAPSPVSQ